MQRTEIAFQKGSILRKEMLEDMYRYPRVALESYYYPFSDGILYGLEWKDSKANPGHHVITPGALKFHGNIYYSYEEIDVENLFPEAQIDSKYRIFFLENEVITEPSRKIYEMNITFIQSADLNAAKEKGFYYSYIEVEQKKSFVEIEDTKELYALYAARDGFPFSFSSRLLKGKALQRLEEKKNKHQLDFEILRYIYSGESVPASMLMFYLKEAGLLESKDDGSVQEISNDAKRLYEEFLKAIEILENRTVGIANAGESEQGDSAQNSTKKLSVSSQGGML